MVYYAAVYAEFLVASEICIGIFWVIKVSKWKISRVANCHNEMQMYWGYEEATSADVM